jgi:hypothetical protein
VLVWDGLNTHTSRAMRELIAARDWLTVFHLPGLRARAEPGRAGLVAPETIAGQPGQAGHQSADRAGQDPAPANAVPAEPPRGLPGQDQARPHTPSVTPTIEDR